jgi:cyclopropane-fatty-acyl-phospholipid synthase
MTREPFGFAAARHAGQAASESAAEVQLLSRLVTGPRFRLPFASGVSADQACFERELLDRYRLVFEKSPAIH